MGKPICTALQRMLNHQIENMITSYTYVCNNYCNLHWVVRVEKRVLLFLYKLGFSYENALCKNPVCDFI